MKILSSKPVYFLFSLHSEWKRNCFIKNSLSFDISVSFVLNSII